MTPPHCHSSCKCLEQILTTINNNNNDNNVIGYHQCYHCKKQIPYGQHKICSCKHGIYCSRQCQKDNWNFHKPICKKYFSKTSP